MRPGDQRLDEVLEALAAHRPADAAEAWSLGRTRALATWLPRPFDETADATHLTASAVVVDAAGRVILHRHKRLGLWLQPGGHVDPDERAPEAARRETLEETGLATEHPSGGPLLVHVDVHPGPRGHLHLDLRYLLLADADGALRPADGESPDVAWFTVAEVAAVGDASLRSAVRAGTAALTTRRGGPRPRRRG